jgi:hypothetical protein
MEQQLARVKEKRRQRILEEREFNKLIAGKVQQIKVGTKKAQVLKG